MKESAGQDPVPDPHETAAGRLRFPKILIPTDSRETAQLMVPLAKKLLAPGGNIVTLNVIDTTFPLEVIDKWKKSTRISIAAVEAGYANEVNVTPEVKNSKSIVNCILEEAGQMDMGLLMFVINPHEGKRSFRFGSKTRSIVRNATCSVMMLNKLTLAMPSRQKGKMLVAIKGDAEGREVLKIAKTLSDELGGLPIIQYRMPDGTVRKEAQRNHAGAGEYRTFAKVYYGTKVADAILNELAKEKYSLVLISSNISRSALPFYSGGAFEYLMKNAPCPVMIYRKVRP